MKIIAIIPALNSAVYLARLLPEVKKHVPDILVIDDGSTDDTKSTAESCRATVIRHESNRGKGAALRTGFEYALQHDFDLILTLDADCQHDAKYIPNFLDAYQNSGADLIVGSRVQDKADMPRERRFSNWTTSHILSFLLKYKVEDSQCGYRLHTRKLLESLTLESDRYELETEIIIKAIQSCFTIKFIPVRVEYGYGYPSHISHIKDTLRWCRRVLELI
jgi:glycosyltransferase involved in cell wall biosynthesis